jgi:hypothetical protein
MSYTMGLGALSAAQSASLKQLLPPCYDAEFDYCWDDAHEHTPGCERYAPLYALYHLDAAAVDAAVEALPYCVPYCRPSFPAVTAPTTAPKPSSKSAPAASAAPTYLGLTGGQILTVAGAFGAGVALTLIVVK